MNRPKLLMDTNIIFKLEDNELVSEDFSSLQQKCSEHGIKLYVHEESAKDIERDKNDQRKKITLSKINKFEKIEGTTIPNKNELEKEYGRIKGENDYVDVVLLHTLKQRIVDFLITEDHGIHKRAKDTELDGRVFKAKEALLWVRHKYENISVPLPSIKDTHCHKIDREDNIFNSLEKDYPEFREWFVNSCVNQHRACWVIKLHNEDEIAGIAIRKNESFQNLKSDLPNVSSDFTRNPKKILKICTFKINERYRGEKLGEQLLKQIFWWSYRNKYDLVYLTVYSKHEFLIDLLTQYGFRKIGNKDKENVLAKAFSPEIFNIELVEDALKFAYQYYPNFRDGKEIEKFLIPIHSDFYQKLFPENDRRIQLPLPFLMDGSGIPCHTIRKVYVCHAQIKKIKPGSILLFYHTKDTDNPNSQRLLTIGIVDGFHITNCAKELLRLTAKRSVFNEKELKEFTKNDTKDVKVINFLLVGHLQSSILFKSMEGIDIKGPYQSIRGIEHNKYQKLDIKSELHVQEE